MKNKVLFLLGIVTLVMASFVLAHQHSLGYQAGDKATDFKLKNIGGNEMSLADFKEPKALFLYSLVTIVPARQNTKTVSLRSTKNTKPLAIRSSPSTR
jgi:hypothetical protein